MPIRVICPSCRASFTLSDSARGKTVRCTNCHGAIPVGERDEPVEELGIREGAPDRPRVRVPSLPAAPRVRPRDEEFMEERPRQRPPAGGSGVPWLIGGAAGGLLVIAGIVLFVLGITSDSADTKQPPPVVQAPPPVVPPVNVPPVVPPPVVRPPEEKAVVIQPFARRVGVEARESLVKDLVFAGPKANRAGVAHVDLSAPGIKNFVDVFDLDKGARLTRLELPGVSPPDQIDLNPEGTRAAARTLNVEAGRLNRRVNVWSLPDGKEVVKDWEPYPAKPGDFDRELVWASLLSGDRVLTLTQRGQFDVWGLPEREPLYGVPKKDGTVSLQVNGFSHFPQNFALGPDRGMLAVFHAEGFTLFETDKGKELGRTESLAAEGSFSNVWATAFSNDGKVLACLFTLNAPGAKRGTVLACWEVPSGKRLTLGRVGDGTGGGYTGGLTWWGKDHVVLWNGNLTEGLLYDVKAGAAVRRCQRAGHGRFAATSPDGRLWFATGQAPLGPALLTAVDLPGADLRAHPAGGADLNNLRRWTFSPDGISAPAR